MTHFKAFIFDMDGTMVDNMEFHLQSWLELFRRQGKRIDEAKFRRGFSGRTTTDLLGEVYGGQLSETTAREYSEIKEEIYRQLYQPHIQPLPGLVAFLESARQLSIPMAVATSAMKKNVDFVLDRLGVRHYFQALVGVEDIHHSKPHPEINLTAAQRLGVRPGDCLVFEDSLAGIESARRAGMHAVVVTTALAADQVLAMDAVVRVIKDFTGLHPGELIKTIHSEGENEESPGRIRNQIRLDG